MQQSIFWNSGGGSQDLIMWILSSISNSDLCLKCLQVWALKVMKWEAWLSCFSRSFLLCWPIPEVKTILSAWPVLSQVLIVIICRSYRRCVWWPLKCSTFCFPLQFHNHRLYIANWRSHQVLQFSAITVETHAKEKFWEFRTNISILSALFAKVSVCDSSSYE